MLQRPFYKLQRLFLDQLIDLEQELIIKDKQYHYLINVLRLKVGDKFLIFNGKQGEYLAEIIEIKKKYLTIKIIQQTNSQPDKIDIIYCFALLKHARLDYMVQKAVEMGANILQPILTQHTQISKVSLDKIRANAIEACEQSGNLNVPLVRELINFDKFLNNWNSEIPLIFCDETCFKENPLQKLIKMPKLKSVALLIGPEGGFSEQERKQLRALPFVISIGLGSRILRADTAAVAALTVIGLTVGDW
ncbi:16S rRNA (uracil(1498)-N(3))-methyltransferase [Bartonella sp. DGB1]|uniref:16S rRNA (uracil(1498)-N(3))-methyltransferase n=1 Tax=Bartonella sp. DGB1 TaxID=3239807 RepID=UPI0035254696